ncbi:hypothetical protein AMTRI_Chr13g124580 [Amborella trichopoda]
MKFYVCRVFIMENSEQGIHEDLQNKAKLRKRVGVDKNDSSMKDLVMFHFETILLTLGFSLDDPNTFAGRSHMMLKLGLSINEDKAANWAHERPLSLSLSLYSKTFCCFGDG